MEAIEVYYHDKNIYFQQGRKLNSMYRSKRYVLLLNKFIY